MERDHCLAERVIKNIILRIVVVSRNQIMWEILQIPLRMMIIWWYDDDINVNCDMLSITDQGDIDLRSNWPEGLAKNHAINQEMKTNQNHNFCSK